MKFFFMLLVAFFAFLGGLKHYHETMDGYWIQFEKYQNLKKKNSPVIFGEFLKQRIFEGLYLLEEVQTDHFVILNHGSFALDGNFIYKKNEIHHPFVIKTPIIQGQFNINKMSNVFSGEKIQIEQVYFSKTIDIFYENHNISSKEMFVLFSKNLMTTSSPLFISGPALRMEALLGGSYDFEKGKLKLNSVRGVGYPEHFHLIKEEKP